MRKNAENKVPNCTCDYCHADFYKPIAEVKRCIKNYCSKKCMGMGNITKQEVKCKHCEVKFLKLPNQILKSPNHYCSSSCAASYNNAHKTYGIRRAKLEVYLEEQIRAHYPELELICNQKSAINSELDFYFPTLRFAIELNGITHYEPIYGEKTFNKIQNNDKRKIIACYEKDIELAIVDSSSCSYLSPNNKEKYKNIVFGLIEKVRHRI
jgi:hypothetical protein